MTLGRQTRRDRLDRSIVPTESGEQIRVGRNSSSKRVSNGKGFGALKGSCQTILTDFMRKRTLSLQSKGRERCVLVSPGQSAIYRHSQALLPVLTPIRWQEIPTKPCDMHWDVSPGTCAHCLFFQATNAARNHGPLPCFSHLFLPIEPFKLFCSTPACSFLCVPASFLLGGWQRGSRRAESLPTLPLTGLCHGT